MRARATIAMKRKMTARVASELDRTFPRVLSVLTRAATGPKDSSSVAPPPSRQVCTSPTNDILGLGRVLPTGVLQHAAYQRSIPFGESRIQASASLPSVNVTLAARI